MAVSVYFGSRKACLRVRLDFPPTTICTIISKLTSENSLFLTANAEPVKLVYSFRLTLLGLSKSVDITQAILLWLKIIGKELLRFSQIVIIARVWKLAQYFTYPWP